MVTDGSLISTVLRCLSQYRYPTMATATTKAPIRKDFVSIYIRFLIFDRRG